MSRHGQHPVTLTYTAFLSGGTKGADTAEPNLGVVKGTGSTVAVELLPPDGADAAYARSVENIKTRKTVPKPVGKSTSQMEQETKDYYVRSSSERNGTLLTLSF
jgi:hypothetical protein